MKRSLSFFSLLILQIITCVHAWKKYEEIIQLGTPNENGVYEFDLTLRHRLTMSTQHMFRELSIIDYVPENMAWEERDKDQLKACFENRTLFDKSDLEHTGYEGYTYKAEKLLPDLLQHTGIHQRVVAVNNVSPGPTIVVPLGAEVVFHVRNRLLLEAVTIHVHGLDMLGVWYNAGLAYIQQCPISAKSDYTYRFRADRIGTHFYHGQFPRHIANGLVGAFVVVPVSDKDDTATELDYKMLSATDDREFERLAAQTLRNESQTMEGEVGNDEIWTGEEDSVETMEWVGEEFTHFDKDYVALLQDWPVSTSEEHEQTFNDMSYKWGAEYDPPSESHRRQPYCTRPAEWNGIPNTETLPFAAILVNRKGWYSQRDLVQWPSRLPLTTYRVSSGDNIRLRIIHGGYENPLLVHVEGHRLQVIAADGSPVRPVMIDRLMIYPGERYDVRLRMTRKPVRKVYRMVVATEEHYYVNYGDNVSVRIPFWSSVYRKPTHAPIFGLANFEFQDGSVHHLSDGDKVDFYQKACQQIPSTGNVAEDNSDYEAIEAHKCLVLNCPFLRIPRQSVVFNAESGRSSAAIDGDRYRCMPAVQLELRVNDGGDGVQALERSILGKNYHLSRFQEFLVGLDPNMDVDGRVFRNPYRPMHFGADNQYPECETHCRDRVRMILHYKPCYCFYHVRFPLNDIVQMTFYAMAPWTGRHQHATHTMKNMGRTISVHLHGTHFYVVKMGFPTFNDNYTLERANPDLPCDDVESRCLDLRWRNLTWFYGNVPGMNHQASLRDTVMVPYGGYTIIRFRARNAGWWLVETMNKGYNDGGTKFSYAIGDDDQMARAPENFPLSCGHFDPGPLQNPLKKQL